MMLEKETMNPLDETVWYVYEMKQEMIKTELEQFNSNIYYLANTKYKEYMEYKDYMKYIEYMEYIVCIDFSS